MIVYPPVGERDEPVRRRTVLVVDDDSAVSSTVAEIISLKEYDVITAADGQDGFNKYVAALDEFPITIIFSDMRMQPVGGIELARRSRKKSTDAGVPLYFIGMSGTCYDGDYDGELATYKTLVDCFLEKPAKIRAIYDALAQAEKALASPRGSSQ